VIVRRVNGFGAAASEKSHGFTRSGIQMQG
jgi:hypothetical protein